MKIVSLNTIAQTTTSHDAAGKKKNMIPNGQIPHLSQFSQVTFAPGEVATEHKHDDMYEVFFVESGEGQFRVNGKLHALTKGDCITIEPGELHEFTNTSTEDVVLTYFGIVYEK